MWIAGVATHHLLIKYSLIQKTYRTSMTESDDELAELQGRLGQLRTEHRDLDDVMARLVEKAPFSNKNNHDFHTFSLGFFIFL